MIFFVSIILSLVNCLQATPTLDFVPVEDGNKRFECVSDSNTPPQDRNIEYRFFKENGDMQPSLPPDSSDIRRRLVYHKERGLSSVFSSPLYVFASKWLLSNSLAGLQRS